MCLGGGAHHGFDVCHPGLVGQHGTGLWEHQDQSLCVRYSVHEEPQYTWQHVYVQ